jgi:hypothetical protein
VGSSPPNAREEINDLGPGGNYGWPRYEGYTDDPNYVSPLYAYSSGVTDPDTGDFVCAIVGGTFYNPDTVQFPADYVGTYFFSDLCGHWIKQFNPDTGDVTVFATAAPGSKVDLIVDPAGSLYYLSRDSGGRLYRIDYTASEALPGGGLGRDAALAGLALAAPTGTAANGAVDPAPVSSTTSSSQAGSQVVGTADQFFAASVGQPQPVADFAWMHAPARVAEDQIDFLFADPLAG